MATDLLSSYADAPTFPARRLLAIVPDDGVDLACVTKWLFIGGTGTLNVLAVGDTVPVALSVAAGALLPLRAQRVLATGTTATGIVGGY